MIRRLFLMFAVIMVQPAVVCAEPVYNAHVKVDLLADVAAVQPGTPFWAAIHMDMDDDWHVYWKNPGDSGLPTVIKWGLPEGLQAGEVQWPFPKRIDYPELTSYGYEDQVLLLCELTPSEDLTAGSDVTVALHIEWLSCGKMCIPGKADLRQALPVREEPSVDEIARDIFRETMKDWPMTRSAWTVTAYGDEASYVFRLTPPEAGAPELVSVTFFPDSEEIIDHQAEQVFGEAQNDYTLRVPKSTVFKTDAARLTGVLVAQEGWTEDRRALVVDVPVE